MPSNTILIIDDDAMARATIEALLLPEDLNLEFSASGSEALARLEEINPDLILLDVMMPQMDGIEVCRRIRTNLRLAEVPIILITSLNDRETRLDGLNAGADEYITKPFDRLELLARVRNVLKLNRTKKLLLERERMNTELTQAYEATLEGWSKALSLREPETEKHSRRVIEWTVSLAKFFNYSDSELVHIHRGALLHDIGKMGIPDVILLKPGPLTETEWKVMKLHPVHAYELLSPIQYLQPAISIPYCHHEKWDGSGYPRGLQGIDIPFPARMFAIADVWDSLTKPRVFRTTTWSEEDTWEYIRQQGGKQFDPQVVEAFSHLLAQKTAS